MFVPEEHQNADFRPMGFAVNPFVETVDRSQRIWLRQEAWAAGAALLSAILRAAALESRKPIMVLISPEIPDAYYREAENRFLAMTAKIEQHKMLALNVPLEMMRLGRTRGTLAEVAELVAAVDFERTIGLLCAAALAEPDTELAEWPELDARGPEWLAELHADFSGDPVRSVVRYLGPSIPGAASDESEDEVSNLMVREAYLREAKLEREPEETDESDEDTTDDEPGMGWEAFQAMSAEEPDEIDVPGTPREIVRDYLIAYTRKHVSPVVARAVRSYQDDGTATVAGELKVTRAPKKTLRALAHLIATRWDVFAVLYDRFDPYPGLDEAGRAAVLAGLTELRWTLADDCVFGILVVEGTAPEVEEQFAGGEVLRWTFPKAQKLYEGQTEFDPELVQGWLDAAALGGVSPISVSDARVQTLAERSGMDIERFVPAAARAFASAATRGLAALDDDAVEDAFPPELGE